MVARRVTVIFLLTLFTSSDGYRVNSLSRDKVEARGKSRGKVTFKRVQSFEGAGSNSSIFIAAGLIGAFAGTLSVTAAAPGVVTAAAGASALVSNCAPSIGLVAPALAGGAGAATPALMVVAPLALLAALALVGGLVALHISSQTALAALAFCPVSNFAQEPMQALVNSQPYLAFPDDLPEMMDDGLDGGMPQCNGMRSAVLASTRCSPGDKECQEHACREKCCEDESCTFYQFSVDPSSAGADSTEVVCDLGEKHQLVDSNCEKPFFGEVCSNRLPFWKQVGKDHTKCQSGYGAGSGFLVDDQMDCQDTAVTNGHCYYQYNDEKKTCATCSDDSDMDEGVRDNWKVFKDPSCGGSHVVNGAVCNDWQLKKVLMHKMKETEEVRPVSRGCRGNSAACLKKRCRSECSKKADCTFYQFQEDTNKCFLGTAEILDEEGQEGPSYGGFVSAERKCKTGYQCPTTNQCVDNCQECEGFSQNGETTSGRGKKRNWCQRTTVQSMCNDDSWASEYRGVSVGQWCEGMETVTVLVDDELDIRETGENICKKACCSNPDCAVYQMDQVLAKRRGSEFKRGDEVACQLGLQTSGGKALFKCAGVPPKNKRSKAEPVGMALSARGCTGGSVACLTKRTCVDHCRTECMGAPALNAEAGVCETESSADEEKLSWAKEDVHKHAFKDNLVSATPKMHTKNTKDAYYLEASQQQEGRYAEKDDLLGLQMNSKRVVSSADGDDMADKCDSLKDTADESMLCYFKGAAPAGACECEFAQKQDCSTWFEDEKKLKYVVEDGGMLVFTGDRCTCSAEKTDGMYTCSFGLQSDVPKIKADKADEAALTLSASKTTCDALKQCDAQMKSKMADAVGTVVSFGTHNCGYTYTGSGGDYYCDSKCNCHQELDDDDVEQGKELEDDSCSERVCPGMSSCSSLDYGSYGCGYSCENTAGDFFFCSQDCDCESDE